MGRDRSTSDTKLAIFSILLTMGAQDDLDRLFTFSCHLLKKRQEMRAKDQIAWLKSDKSA